MRTDGSTHADAGRTDGRMADAAAGVQVLQTAKNSNGNASSISASFAAAPAAGHVVVLVGGESNSSDTKISGLGSAWTRAAGSWQHVNLELWYAVATGTGTQVTLTSTDGANPIYILISEWSGLLASDPLDVAGAASGPASGSAASTDARGGPIQTTTGDAIVLAVASDAGSGIATPSGEVEVDQRITSFGVIGDWYEMGTTPGSYNPGMSSPGSWDAAVVAFKLEPP